MYIRKLELEHFGKYNEREIELQRGMNVIYGPNEAGKTTMKDFIVGMFYGIDRQRGIAAKTDEYIRREPFDGTGYSGSMEVEKQGEIFCIDRVFRKDRKELNIYQKSTGRRISSSDEKTLLGTIIDVDKNGYMNTLCIGSGGAAYKSELQEELCRYLTNVNETHASNYNLKGVYSYLNQQKKQLKLKEMEQELSSLNGKIQPVDLEAKLKEIGQRRSDIEGRLQTMNDDTANREQEESPEPERSGESGKNKEEKEKYRDQPAFQKQITDPNLKRIMNFIKVMFAFGVIAIMLLLIYILPISLHYKLWLCVIAIVVMLYAWVAAEIKAWKRKHGNIGPEETSSQKSGKTIDKVPGKVNSKESGRTSRNDVFELSRRLADLQVEENDLLRENANQQDLITQYEQLKKEYKAISERATAIDLAIQKLQELAGTIYDQYAPEFGRRVSELLCEMTDGEYDDVRIDEKLNVQLRRKGRYLGAEHLSTATLEQAYLAVRLAVAEELSTDGMPILLDDIFGAYDDKRLAATLVCISNYTSEQVIIFTAGNRLADILDKTDIEYNYIEL